VTAFRFPLKRVLDWRRTQLKLEETRYKQQAGELAALDRARAEAEAAGIRAEVQVRAWGDVYGRDLGALDGFRRSVKAHEEEIARRRAECSLRLDEQQGVMLEARRRCRLLERLEERKAAEWRAARDREIEEAAAESYLAKWGRVK
jgi:hypothetical protein